jgi:hypothetical protein
MKNLSNQKIVTIAVIASALMCTYAASAANIGYVAGLSGGALDQSFDNGWSARLTSQGHTVTPIDQNTPASTPSLAGFDLFIVSSDVGGSAFLAGVGRDQPKPMLMYEPALYNNIFGASGSTDAINGVVTISDSLHPLAAGLSGTVTIYNGSGNAANFNPGALASGAQYIATADVNSVTRGVFVVLEANASGDAGQTWPALRMGLPAFANWDPSLVTADGWKLLDGAVNYALTPVPEPSSLALIGLGFAAFLARRKGD